MAITPDDVAENLGRPAPTQDSLLYKKWARWITTLETVIAARLGPIAQLAGADYVILETVTERERLTGGGSPDGGQTSTTVTVDDGTVTDRWENVASAGEMRFDLGDDWWGWGFLSPRTHSEAFSTRLSSQPDRPWCRP